MFLSHNLLLLCQKVLDQILCTTLLWKFKTNKNFNKFHLTLFVMGEGYVNFLHIHINLNNPINLVFSDLKFYRFKNILAKFGPSIPGQFGARTFLSKNFSKIFVLWSLKVFLSFICLYLDLYYLKIISTQFFRYLFQDWLFHLKFYLYFNNFWSGK